MKGGVVHHGIGALLYLLGFLIAFSVLPVFNNNIEDIALGAIVVFIGAWFEFKGRRK